MTVRILAVVDSESFLKWAATTLDRIAAEGMEIDERLLIISGPLEPSAEQVRSAIAGTGVTDCPVVSRRELGRLVASRVPDVVLVAATGPVAEMIALEVIRAAGASRPALVSGTPGMAMAKASTAGVRWRYRWCDAYIVHSPREIGLFAEAFARYHAHPRAVLTRLPFLGERTPAPIEPVRRVVFAPQSIVPHSRAERVAILRGLAALHDQGFDVVVKVRTRAGERQTHHEALPFETLWRQEHARLGHDEGALRFEAGPMRDWLAPGAALVTVSSTAALESLALGLPTALISDFGMHPHLANEVYRDSGCLVRLADLAATLRDGGPVADENWLADNYLHAAPSEVATALRELTEARRDGTLPSLRAVRPVGRWVYVYSTLKSDLPALWYPAKWARAILGRFMHLP